MDAIELSTKELSKKPLSVPHHLARWFGAIGCMAFCSTFTILVAKAMYVNPTIFQSVLANHFSALVGLPIAAISALGLVVCLETRMGDVRFKALGIEFHGASGPIVLWVLCFLAMAVAIKFVW